MSLCHSGWEPNKKGEHPCWGKWQVLVGNRKESCFLSHAHSHWASQAWFMLGPLSSTCLQNQASCIAGGSGHALRHVQRQPWFLLASHLQYCTWLVRDLVGRFVPFASGHCRASVPASMLCPWVVFTLPCSQNLCGTHLSLQQLCQVCPTNQGDLSHVLGASSQKLPAA